MIILLLLGLYLVSIKMYIWGIRYNAFGPMHRPGILVSGLSRLVLILSSVLLMLVSLYITWSNYGGLFALLAFVFLVILVLHLNFKMSYKSKAESLIRIYAKNRRLTEKLDFINDLEGYTKFWSEVAMAYRKEIGIGDDSGFISYYIRDEHDKLSSHKSDKSWGDYDLLELIFRDELDGLSFKEQGELWTVMSSELSQSINKYLKSG